MARSFNRAAVEMDISAAVITRRIQELEFALGVKLISRNSRPLSLTQAGDHYLAFCIKILNAMAAEEAALHSLQNDASGKLTVVVPVSLGVMVLAKANAQFATLYANQFAGKAWHLLGPARHPDAGAHGHCPKSVITQLLAN